MSLSTRQSVCILFILLAVMLLLPAVVLADPPPPVERAGVGIKPLDQPNPRDYARNQARQALLENGKTRQANALTLAGSERALVLLVEFAGTDVFTWTLGSSTWDPIGKADTSESASIGDCSKIITETRTFTYTGPLHNQIPLPLSATEPYSTVIWTEDFTPQWYADLAFGNGVAFNYARGDGSPVNADLTGKSVRNYLQDISNGIYSITGTVIPVWLTVPHSAAWYGADQCPGVYANPSAASAGAIPNAGSLDSLAMDALNAVNYYSSTHPTLNFRWTDYDQDHDGIIDRLWIIHAGYGEEQDSRLLNGANYGAPGTAAFGEHAVWSQSTHISIPYPVGEGIAAGPFILLPENAGMGIVVHELAHDLGAADLYSQAQGQASAGFWTVMADEHTGFPLGAVPPAPDPLHLEQWGWLSPLVISDPSHLYTATLGQASDTPNGTNRAIKIQLPSRAVNLPIVPWSGTHYWWGGSKNYSHARMTLASPLHLTASSSAELAFDLAYDVESQYDYLWVQVSTDLGATWKTLTNTNTVCSHGADWVGSLNGFPSDLCAAGIGGFTGQNPSYPTRQVQAFNLAAFTGHDILLRFWYMTDWALLGQGTFIDNIRVTVNGNQVFSDGGENVTANWFYEGPWLWSNGTQNVTQNYYLQWRNVAANGGYDSGLGDTRWRYGPATSGMLVWYNNNAYDDNSISNYVQSGPSFGPKGKMLVVDSHPEPYRDPVRVLDYPNSISNLPSRMQMRDAPFNLTGTPAFFYPYLDSPNEMASYLGRAAVNLFDDSRGYYPGIQWTVRGKDCSVFGWTDKMWDASVVLPARGLYSTKVMGGSGFTASSQIASRGYVNPTSQCQAHWSGPWYVPFADSSNTGNPGDNGAAYGWHVEVIDQSPDGRSATVRIWNTQQPLYLPMISR